MSRYVDSTTIPFRLSNAEKLRKGTVPLNITTANLIDIDIIHITINSNGSN